MEHGAIGASFEVAVILSLCSLLTSLSLLFLLFLFFAFLSNIRIWFLLE